MSESRELVTFDDTESAQRFLESPEDFGCSECGAIPVPNVKASHRPEGDGKVYLTHADHCPKVIEEKARAGFERAVVAEPQLKPVVQMVDLLCLLVRDDDTMCAGCVWERLVKPMVTPWIGWERGYPPKQAKVIEGSGWSTPIDLTADLAAVEAGPVPAETEDEKWLRTSEAFDAFTDALLSRLEDADPANGHGFKRSAS